MAIGTLKDKYPNLTIAQIREGVNNKTLDPLTFEEIEAIFEVVREMKEQRVAGLEESVGALQEWKNNLPAQTTIEASDIGLGGLVTTTPNLPFADYPMQTAVATALAAKPDLVDVGFIPIEGVSNVFEIDYSGASPRHSISITANSVVQLKSMHGLTKGFVHLLVKKSVDTLTLTFQDNTTALAANRPDGVSAGANSYDFYSIEKVGNLFFIDCRPLGVGAAQEVETPQTPTLPAVTNFTITQLADENGVNRVQIKFDAISGETGVSYKVIRPKVEGQIGSTLHQGGYPAGGILIDNGTLNGQPAPQTNTKYYYGVKAYKTGYTDAGYTTIPFTVL